MGLLMCQGSRAVRIKFNDMKQTEREARAVTRRAQGNVEILSSKREIARAPCYHQPPEVASGRLQCSGCPAEWRSEAGLNEVQDKGQVPSGELRVLPEEQELHLKVKCPVLSDLRRQST